MPCLPPRQHYIDGCITTVTLSSEGSYCGTRGGGGLTKFCTGRVRPEVQPLTLLYTILDRKSTLFVYHLLTNGIPFTYLV